MRLRRIDDVLSNFPKPNIQQLAAPKYNEQFGPRMALAVESMKRHMTDEGWQIMLGLESANYKLAGHRLPISETDVASLLIRHSPEVVVVQDKREWDSQVRDFRDKEAKFTNIESLAEHSDIFKLTILKDAHQRPQYHADSASEMGCHAWIIYYHPRIVAHLAPYVRPQHLVRTYHSIDPAVVPEYTEAKREGCLLSGASSGAYPLRQRLIAAHGVLPGVTYLKHPGYHRNGAQNVGFMHTLAKYKLAICTSSRYGYALRKIIEATACGCKVITDLPTDEVLPEIDGNLVRIPDWYTPRDVIKILPSLYDSYSPSTQLGYVRKALQFYDYKAIGSRLANDIENLRSSYPQERQCS